LTCLYHEWRSVGRTPGGTAFKRRGDVVLDFVLVLEPGGVNGDGGEDLKDAVEENPTSETRIAWWDAREEAGFFVAAYFVDKFVVWELMLVWSVQGVYRQCY
jgi:hypothetical protein